MHMTARLSGLFFTEGQERPYDRVGDDNETQAHSETAQVCEVWEVWESQAREEQKELMLPTKVV